VLGNSTLTDPAEKIVRRKVASGTDKVHFSRRRTWPEDSEKTQSKKLGRSHSQSFLTSRARGCKKDAPNEESQVQAMKALATQMASKKPFQDVMLSLCCHVMKHDSSRAFAPEVVRQSVNSILGARGSEASTCDKDLPAGPLAIRVLRELASDVDMSLADVAGQILWHFRKADALSDRLMRKTAKDLSWVEIALVERMKKLSMSEMKTTEHVEKAFQLHANEDGRLDERTFLRMMERSLQSYMVQDSDGVIQFEGSRAACRRTELDQLFYAVAHHKGHREINCDDFKHMLVKLAHSMSVHPASIFIAVGELSSCLHLHASVGQ